MNLQDLADLMRERADVLEPPLPVGRLASVERRAVISHRRRVSAAVAVVVAVVVVAVIGLPQLFRLHADRAVLPTSVETRDGLAVYDFGWRLVASTSGPTTRQISFTFTPTTNELTLDTACATNGDTAVLMVTVGNHEFADATCGQGVLSVSNSTEARGFGLEVGKPVTITARVTGGLVVVDGPSGEATTSPNGPLPAGRFAIGMRVPVPFDQYKFPPRPSRLRNLGIRVGANGGQYGLVSKPDDPDASRSYTFTWPSCAPTARCFDIYPAAVTPGMMYLAVNGTTVFSTPFWDYSSHAAKIGTLTVDGLAKMGVNVKAGSTVTVTVTTEHMTGDWGVLLENHGG